MTNLNKTTINQIIQSSIKEPLAPFYVIVKDKQLVEEAFLKMTPSLFNIEIITYGELLALLRDLYRRNHIQSPDPDASLLFLKEYLDTQNFTTFKNCSIATIRQLLEFIGLAHDYQSRFEFASTSELTRCKLEEFHAIAQAYEQSLGDETCMSLEDDLLPFVDKRIGSWHCYFIMECYSPKQASLIEALADQATVVRLDHSSHEPSPLAHHLEGHFFSDDQACDRATPYRRLDLGVASMQYSQVAQAIFTAVKNREQTYSDFAVVVNNPADLEKMSRTLGAFNIPCNGKFPIKNNPYLAVVALKNYLLNHDQLALMAFLGNPAIHCDFGVYDQIEYQKTGIMPATILDDFTMEPVASLKEYTAKMTSLLEEHFSTSPQTLEIRVQLEKLGKFETSLALADFFDLLLDKIQVRPTPSGIMNDHVYLLDLSSPWLEILDIKQVYVLSINEDIYPKKIKNNKLLLDDELSLLELPTIKDQLDLENGLILNLFKANVSKMVFCCPLFNLKSEPLLLASVFKNLFKRYKVQKEPLQPNTSHDLLVHELYRTNSYVKEKAAVNELIVSYERTSNQPDILERKPQAAKLSPSQIETYNSCPFKYFLNYNARLRPLPQSKIQANQTGTLIHHLIEQSQEFIENYDFEKLPNHLRLLTDQFVADNKIVLNSYNKLLLARIQEDMVVTLAILNKQQLASHSKILATEKYVSHQGDSLELHGKIDRVDSLDDYVAVVDYKGSAKKLDEKYLVLGVNIQMMVYLYMMARQSDKKPGGVFYFNYAPTTLQSKGSLIDATFDGADLIKEKRMVALQDEQFADLLEDIEDGADAITFKGKKNKTGTWAASSGVKSAAELDSLMNEIITYIESLSGNLGDGNIPIAPIVSDIEDKMLLKPCTYCDYKAICKFDPFYNEYRNLEKEVKANESK